MRGEELKSEKKMEGQGGQGDELGTLHRLVDRKEIPIY